MLICVVRQTQIASREKIFNIRNIHLFIECIYWDAAPLSVCSILLHHAFHANDISLILRNNSSLHLTTESHKQVTMGRHQAPFNRSFYISFCVFSLLSLSLFLTLCLSISEWFDKMLCSNCIRYRANNLASLTKTKNRIYIQSKLHRTEIFNVIYIQT